MSMTKVSANREWYHQLLLTGGDIASFLKVAAALTAEGYLSEALACYRKILAVQPQNVAANFYLGALLEKEGKLAEAESFLQKAAALKPTEVETHLLLANVLLKQGKLHQGFEEYEWRKQKNLENLAWFDKKPVWTGEIFSGKTLLIYSEQGMGDAIQFIRYLPQVKARGGRVIVLARHPLVRLFETCAGIDEIFDEKVNLSDFDLSISMMSLPKIFGTSLKTIPKNIPYIVPARQEALQWQTIIPATTKKKVGLVWSGNTYGGSIPNRSAALSDFAGLAAVPDTVFYSLQKGEPAEELLSPPPGLEIVDLAPRLTDFAATAAAIAQLDLVISIDTSVPHLVGAMGKPVWILLPFYSEWRWLTERDDSPWYPSVKLFRQTTAGDWAEVIRRAATELSLL